MVGKANTKTIEHADVFLRALRDKREALSLKELRDAAIESGFSVSDREADLAVRRLKREGLIASTGKGLGSGWELTRKGRN